MQLHVFFMQFDQGLVEQCVECRVKGAVTYDEKFFYNIQSM